MFLTVVNPNFLALHILLDSLQSSLHLDCTSVDKWEAIIIIITVCRRRLLEQLLNPFPPWAVVGVSGG